MIAGIEKGNKAKKEEYSQNCYQPQQGSKPILPEQINKNLSQIESQKPGLRPIFVQQVSKNPFSRPGFNGITIYNKNRITTATPLYCYELTPHGMGQIDLTLRERFELAVGPISYMDEERRIHPLFEFLVEKMVMYYYLSHVKETQFQIDLRVEIRSKSKNQLSFVREQEENILNQLVGSLMAKYIHKKKFQPEKKSRIEKLKNFQDELNTLFGQKKEKYLTLIWDRFNRDKSRLFQDSLSDTMAEATWPEIRSMANFLCNTVQMISPLKLSTRRIRYHLFKNIYKEYYLIFEEDDTQKVQLKKYSTEAEGLLHTVEDYVYLSRETVFKEEAETQEQIQRRQQLKQEYKAKTVQLLKDTVIALKSFQETVSKEQFKYYYYYVNPQNIIFDQFALNPKLVFDPILEEHLCLTQKPYSIESKLAYCPTPIGFDYFRSLSKMDKEVQLKLSDPFYGNLSLHGQKKYKLEAGERAQIESERLELLGIKENQLVWRLLLLGWYLLNEREYGKCFKTMTEPQQQEYFIKQLQGMKSKLSESSSALKEYLGVQNEVKEPFNFTFRQILDYLKLDIKDKYLESFKYERIKLYHDHRNKICRELIKIFIGEKILEKMMNIKKYICMFCILAYQIMVESETLLQCEALRDGERSKVRIVLERDNKARNGKTFPEYMENIYQKIVGYSKRDFSDAQSKYLNRDTQGIKNFQIVKKIRKHMCQLINICNQLNKFEKQIINVGKADEGLEREKKQKEIQNLRAEFNVHFEELKQKIMENHPAIKKQIIDVMMIEINADNPTDLRFHKIADSEKADQNVRASRVLFNKKLVVTMCALLLYEKDNMLNFETLVIPMLNLKESEKSSIKEEKMEQIQNNMSAYEMILRLIDSDGKIVKPSFYSDFVAQSTFEEDYQENLILKSIKIKRTKGDNMLF